eukprot:1158363-Pelagomonas_calceolata.AAC.8
MVDSKTYMQIQVPCYKSQPAPEVNIRALACGRASNCFIAATYCTAFLQASLGLAHLAQQLILTSPQSGFRIAGYLRFQKWCFKGKNAFHLLLARALEPKSCTH